MTSEQSNQLLFDVKTPFDFSVRTSISFWDIITKIKHPVMTGRETDVQNTLAQPDEVRRSRSDPNVYLFYKLQQEKRWICAVARRLNGDGFLVTTYPTDAIKEGEIIWQK